MIYIKIDCQQLLKKVDGEKKMQNKRSIAQENSKDESKDSKMYGLRRMAVFENLFESKDEKGNVKKSIVFYVKKTVLDEKSEEYKEVKGLYIEDLLNLRAIIDVIVSEHVNRK